MRTQLAATALTVAAVIGTTAGVAVALQNAPSTKGGHESGSRAPTSSATQSSAESSRLLYATDTAIHDGDRTIPLRGPHHVSQIARADGGYVVAEPTSSQDAAFDLWYVTSNGNADDFAGISGTWDLDPTGKRAVGFDPDVGKITVWDVVGGRAEATWPGTTDATGDAVFAGNKVLVAQSGDHEQYDLIAWDPSTGKTAKQPGSAFTSMAASPGGSYLSGLVDKRGLTSATGVDTCLAVRSTYLKKSSVDWHSCDYTAYDGTTSFSPDGTGLLAVPHDTDGFGPGELDVIDASDGPRDLVGHLRTPEYTLGAGWAGDDALYVYGAVGNDPEMGQGAWIDRCDLSGKCKRVATSKERLVVASTL